MHHKITFMTGASGVGKTSLTKALEKRLGQASYQFFYFDDIGIPPGEVFEEYAKQGRNWQEEATHTWVERLIEASTHRPVIFEGQTNPNFILDAFQQAKFDNYQIILLECEEAEMNRRLIEERQQPDLANPDMANWRRYLHAQAVEKGIEILETSQKDLEETVGAFIERFL